MIASGRVHEQQEVVAPTSVSQWRLIWRAFRRQRLGMIGLVILLLMVVVTIVVPIFFPNPYPSVNPDPKTWYAPVGTVSQMDGHVFVLGGDRYGRDYLILMLKGTQFTLLVAVIPTILVLIIGFLIGAISGYFGGWLDTGLMQAADFLLILPLLPACLIGVGFIEVTPLFSHIQPQWLQTLLALATIFTLFGWMGIARLVRALVLSLRTENFVEASRVLGASNSRIVFRHLLPNTSSSLLVAGTLAIGDFAVIEAVLAYFGKGVQDSADPSMSSLGTWLAANTDLIWYLTNLNPFTDIRGYLILFPIIFLIIIVVAINFMGDALRDVLDPHTQI